MPVEQIPIVKTYLELKIPVFEVRPSLTQMNDDFEKCIQCTMSVCKWVAIWGQRGFGLEEKHFSPHTKFEYHG